MKQSDLIQLATIKIRQMARRGSNRILHKMVSDLYLLGLQEGMKLMAEQLKDRIKAADTVVELVTEEVQVDNESISDGDDNGGVGGEPSSSVPNGSPGPDADDVNSGERS